MPDAAAEIIYTGVGRFVKEKIIAPHTPEAHYQKIMKKYFWVTDRLEGSSLELAERLRPQVELAARAAGWSQTIMELYLAGQAAAFMAFLGYRGLKSAAGVFGDLARKHEGTKLESNPPEPIIPVALLESPRPTAPPVIELGPATGAAAAGKAVVEPKPTPKPPRLKTPPHVSPGRADGFARVTDKILDRPTPRARPHARGKSDGDWLAKAMRSALRDFERLNPRDEVMRTAGKEARSFGDYLKEKVPNLPDEERRHAQRALAHVLQGLLSENGGASAGKRDLKQAFLDALKATHPRGEGLSDGRIDQVFVSLQQFNALKSTT